MSQAGMIAAAGNYTLQAGDSGVVQANAATTNTLPSPITTVMAAQVYVVKNASSGAITVSTGTTGFIDNFAGGIAATTDSVDVNASATYVPDTNLLDWVKV